LELGSDDLGFVELVFYDLGFVELVFYDLGSDDLGVADFVFELAELSFLHCSRYSLVPCIHFCKSILNLFGFKFVTQIINKSL